MISLDLVSANFVWAVRLSFWHLLLLGYTLDLWVSVSETVFTSYDISIIFFSFLYIFSFIFHHQYFGRTYT